MKKTKSASKKAKLKLKPQKHKLMPRKSLLTAFFVVLIFSLVIAVRNEMNHRRALDTPSAIAQNDTEELKEIKQKIKDKKAKWEAADTSILKLPKEERKKRVMENLEKPANIKLGKVPSAPTTVTNLDWRDGSGTGSYSGAYVTPVKDQGSCGSCWDFAATATAESAILLKNKTTFASDPIDLSEQVMLSCSGAGTCSGGFVQNAANFLQTTGLPAESCYPYTATNGSCSLACSNWQASTSKITDSKMITSTAPDAGVIRSAVLTYGPITTTMAVYNDFFAYRTGVYSYTTGSLAGYHAVEIVGFDDSAQAFIVKNSWGTGWGEAGFFKIAYSEVNGKSQFGQYSIAFNMTTPVNLPEADSTVPVVTITQPLEGAIVSNGMPIYVKATDNIGISKIELYFDDQFQYALQQTDTLGQFNISRFSDGPHSFYVKAYDPAGNVGKSQTVNVIVKNVPTPPITPDASAPVVTISTPKDGSTVSGKVSMSASAIDDVAVTGMEIYLNDKLKASSTNGAISWVWDTHFINMKYVVNPFSVTVKAKDAAGNISSKSISINLGRGNTRKK